MAEDSFTTHNEVYAGAVVLEPRHATWFTAGVAATLRRFEIARVGADPARVPGAAKPGGWAGLRYWRLHGSPRTYDTSYDAEWLKTLAADVCKRAAEGAECWCIFDNTAAGAALPNARELAAFL